jgi:hypothetical protein
VNYELTQHARDVMEERQIAMDWMERALDSPALIETSATDLALESRFAKIPEFDNRVLRVIINTQVVPARVVSVYFDRRMKGRL